MIKIAQWQKDETLLGDKYGFLHKGYENDFVHLCVVAFSPAVASSILSPNEVVGTEELAVRRSLVEVIILI